MDIEEQYDKIYRYCYFRLRDRYLAQDIAQEAFLRFYRQGLSLDKGRELPYLYTIARNLCIDEFRRRRLEGAGGIGAGNHRDAADVKDAGAGVTGREAIGMEGLRTGTAHMEAAVWRDGLTAASDSQEAWIDSMVLKAVIGRLPQEEQELLLLRYGNEASMASICKITGMSRFAVYRRLSKILKRLKKELIKEGFSE